MGGIAFPLAFAFPFAMAYAAASDLLTMRISNAVSLAIVAAFFLIAPVAGLSAEQVLMHLGAGVLVLLFGMLLFALRLVGGGDAKLLAAASLWIGFDHLLTFLTWSTIFGGALAVGLLAFRRLPAGAFPLPSWALRLHAKGEGMPYGIAIAAGALLIYPLTPWAVLLA